MTTDYDTIREHFDGLAAAREAEQRGREEANRRAVEDGRAAYAERYYERTLYRRRKLAGTLSPPTRPEKVRT